MMFQQEALESDMPVPPERSLSRRSSAPPMLERSRSSPHVDCSSGGHDPPGIVSHIGDFRTPKRVSSSLPRHVNIPSRAVAGAHPQSDRD